MDLGKEGSFVSPEDLRQPTAKLLEAAGLRGDFGLFPLPGGANNKVFRVEANGHTALLKAYFQHPDDPRDRLGVEFSFSSFAWEHGVRCIPRPLACDRFHHLALYEFVEGRCLQSDEVTEERVRQAIEFYRQLNQYRESPDAGALPEASEACFRIADHLRCVERRLQALKQVAASSPIRQEAVSFILNDLSGIWERVAESAGKRAGELGFSLEEEIVPEDRRLSPSDFGFHNALVASDGRLRFIDFEYAGWDDPAKTACDFFCLQGVRVPEAYRDLFVQQVTQDLSEPASHRQRIDLLFPIHQVKWCCILLNDFLPDGSQRRRFADGSGEGRREAVQLQKARRALQEVRARSSPPRFISGAA